MDVFPKGQHQFWNQINLGSNLGYLQNCSWSHLKCIGFTLKCKCLTFFLHFRFKTIWIEQKQYPLTQTAKIIINPSSATCYYVTSWKLASLSPNFLLCKMRIPPSYLTAVLWGLNENILGLPWWRSGWESACQCRGHGFEPWSGKIPHTVEQLGPWATIAEPAHLEPVDRKSVV